MAFKLEKAIISKAILNNHEYGEYLLIITILIIIRKKFFCEQLLHLYL